MASARAQGALARPRGVIMAKMNAKQMEQVQAMGTVYAELNAAEFLAVAKPMRGAWSWYMVPLTAANVAALTSDVEHTEEGLKFRIRPNNSTFYRVARANSVEPMFLASDELVTDMVASLTLESGTRCNRGHAVECLIAQQVGATGWNVNHNQCGFWVVPDVVSNKGERIQCKAYGASITEKDLRAAVATRK